MTPEELEKLENKVYGIIDAAVYGGLPIEGAVNQVVDLVIEERKKVEAEEANNKD